MTRDNHFRTVTSASFVASQVTTRAARNTFRFDGNSAVSHRSHRNHARVSMAWRSTNTALVSSLFAVDTTHTSGDSFQLKRCVGKSTNGLWKWNLSPSRHAAASCTQR